MHERITDLTEAPGSQFDLRRLQPLKDELREVFSYPLKHCAAVMHHFIDQCGPEVINMMAQWHPVDKPIPYSVSGLSPFLFANEPRGRPIDFASEADIDSFMATFEETHSSWARKNYDTVPQFHDIKNRQDCYSIWGDNLKATLGTGIDPDEWQYYAEIGKQQVRRGYCNLDYVSAHVGRKSLYEFNQRLGVFDVATDRHESFLLANTSSILSPVVGWNQMPIGPYGEGHAVRLLRAMGVMMDFMEHASPLHRELTIFGALRPEVLYSHTVRGTDAISHKAISSIATAVSQEGVQAVGMALTAQTSSLVAGYERNPQQLLHRINQENLVEKYTRLTSLGILGGLMTRGFFVPDLIESPDVANSINDSDRMRFTKEAAKRYGAASDIANRAIASDWAAYENDLANGQFALRPVRLGRQCPLVKGRNTKKADVQSQRRKTAIGQMAGVMIRLYDIIDPELGNRKKNSLPWETPRAELQAAIEAAYRDC